MEISSQRCRRWRKRSSLAICAVQKAAPTSQKSLNSTPTPRPKNSSGAGLRALLTSSDSSSAA